MIDLRLEKPVSFAEATKAYVTHPSVATLWRWTLKGIRGVRLETATIGGRRYTSLEAIDRFASQLTALGSPEGPKPTDLRTL